MLAIRLFGSPNIAFDGRDLQSVIPEQATAILCYLILNRERPLHRDTVVGHFWADSPQEKARKALRTAIWRIRSALEGEGSPPVLLADNDYVGFNNEIPCWVDVEAFKTLIAEAQDCQHIQPAASAEALHAAIELYRADLLEGWADEWILYERMHLESLYLNALTELMSYHGTQQEYHAALQYGMMILHCDPLLESVHRHMMRLHYWSGNRAAAVRQYRECRKLLIEELDIEPMEETRRLFEQICAENASALSLSVAGSLTVPAEQADALNHQIEKIIRQLKSVQDDLMNAQPGLQVARDPGAT